jgi:hypothetical protein
MVVGREEAAKGRDLRMRIRQNCMALSMPA